jgi:hypothetical protein
VQAWSRCSECDVKVAGVVRSNPHNWLGLGTDTRRSFTKPGLEARNSGAPRTTQHLQDQHAGAQRF